MKKLLIYGAIVGAAVTTLACGDYLKDDSGDLLIPKRVDEYQPILNAEGYPKRINASMGWMKLTTDDVQMGPLELDPLQEAYETRGVDQLDVLNAGEGKWVYVWDANVEANFFDDFWDVCYSYILGCNTIIEALPTIEYTPNETGQYNFLAAQAYGLRAYYYWCLVNTYAAPYSSANLSKDGVILRTTSQVDITSRPRSSIGAVYDLINNDLKLAETYMKDATVVANHFLFGREALYFLQSRVALFQENWDEVIRTSKLFLERNSKVYDLNSADASTFGINSNTNGFQMMFGANPEIIFSFGNTSSEYNHLSVNEDGKFYGLGFQVSHDSPSNLMSLYADNDLRKKAYFKVDQERVPSMWEGYPDDPAEYYYHYPVKYRKVGSGSTNEQCYHENWRSVEVMLNLAEAYVRKSGTVNAEALTLINTLRKGRINKTSYADLSASDFASSEAFLTEIWNERRRELCFEEGMRYWDLRRQGMPSLEHRWYTSSTAFETYTLPVASPNYITQIPSSERRYNEACLPNPRIQIQGVKP